MQFNSLTIDDFSVIANYEKRKTMSIPHLVVLMLLYLEKPSVVRMSLALNINPRTIKRAVSLLNSPIPAGFGLVIAKRSVKELFIEDFGCYNKELFIYEFRRAVNDMEKIVRDHEDFDEIQLSNLKVVELNYKAQV